MENELCEAVDFGSLVHSARGNNHECLLCASTSNAARRHPQNRQRYLTIGCGSNLMVCSRIFLCEVRWDEQTSQLTSHRDSKEILVGSGVIAGGGSLAARQLGRFIFGPLERADQSGSPSASVCLLRPFMPGCRPTSLDPTRYHPSQALAALPP